MKQDRRGHVLVSRERREVLLDEFERSGASAMHFARLAGIKYGTFAGWVQKRRKARATRSLELEKTMTGGGHCGPIRLLEAVADVGVQPDGAGAPPSCGLVVDLPGGSRVVVESPVQMQMAVEMIVLIAQRSRRC